MQELTCRCFSDMHEIWLSRSAVAPLIVCLIRLLASSELTYLPCSLNNVSILVQLRFISEHYECSRLSPCVGKWHIDNSETSAEHYIVLYLFRGVHSSCTWLCVIECILDIGAYWTILFRPDLIFYPMSQLCNRRHLNCVSSTSHHQKNSTDAWQDNGGGIVGGGVKENQVIWIVWNKSTCHPGVALTEIVWTGSPVQTCGVS